MVEFIRTVKAYFSFIDLGLLGERMMTIGD